MLMLLYRVFARPVVEQHRDTVAASARLGFYGVVWDLLKLGGRGRMIRALSPKISTVSRVSNGGWRQTG